MPNPLRTDPTRTTTIVRSFISAINKRLTWLQKEVKRMIETEDSFGLIPPENPFTRNEPFQFLTNPQKVEQFKIWLKEKVDSGLLSPVDDAIDGKPWTAKYIESAYRKGVVRAYIDTHKKDLNLPAGFYEGSKAQFLVDAFSGPIAIDKIKLINTRAFENLKGVTDSMASNMNRIFAEGISAGSHPSVVARNLTNEISQIKSVRAKRLARTEMIYAHAEGQLDSFERLGIEELGIMAEWSTAGVGVCPRCSDLEGVVMTVTEARSLIPLHPNCRCAWIPATLDSKNNKKRTQKAVAKQLATKGKPPLSALSLKDIIKN